MKNNSRTKGKGKKLGYRTPSSFKSAPRHQSTSHSSRQSDRPWPATS